MAAQEQPPRPNIAEIYASRLVVLPQPNRSQFSWRNWLASRRAQADFTPRTAALTLLALGGMIALPPLIVGAAHEKMPKPPATLSDNVKGKLADIKATSAAKTEDIKATMQAQTEAQLAARTSLTSTPVPYENSGITILSDVSTRVEGTPVVIVKPTATVDAQDTISSQIDGVTAPRR